MSGLTRRKVPRVPIYRHALIESEALKGATLGTVYEIGANGCGLRCEDHIAPGTRLKLTFLDQENQNPLTIEVIIVYEQEVRGTELISYGVHFEKIQSGGGNTTHQELDKILESTGHYLLH